jgi:hypothetical protein
MILLYLILGVVALAAYFLSYRLTPRVRLVIAVGVFALLSIAATFVVIIAGDPPPPGSIIIYP